MNHALNLVPGLVVLGNRRGPLGHQGILASLQGVIFFLELADLVDQLLELGLQALEVGVCLF